MKIIMKTIMDLNGVDFLRASNRMRHAVADFQAKTGYADIRSRRPEIPENATPAEKVRLVEIQGQKNFSAMLDNWLDKYPDDTMSLLAGLIITDDPAVAVNPADLTGNDIIVLTNQLMQSRKFIDFFKMLAQSAAALTV